MAFNVLKHIVIIFITVIIIKQMQKNLFICKKNHGDRVTKFKIS